MRIRRKKAGCRLNPEHRRKIRRKPKEPFMPCCCRPEAGSAASPAAEELHCPVETTLRLIGGKYKTLIVWNLFDGTLRFSQLQRLIPRATAKMLTQQLRELERDGLITRRVYPVVPPKVEYALSERGRSLQPILQAIYSWGVEYLEEKGLKANCGMKTPA